MADNFAEGVSLLEKGANLEALHSFDACLSEDPENGGALVMKASALARLERREEAAAVFDRVVGLYPEEDLYLISYAAFLVEGNRLEEANRMAGKALSLAFASQSPERVRDIALACEQARLFQTCFDANMALCQAQTNSLETGLRVVAKMADAGHTQNALALLDQFAQQGNQDSRVYRLGAAILTKQREWRHVETIAKVWVDQHPKDVDGWRVLSQALFKSYRFDESLEAFQKIVNLEGNDPKALLGLGQIALAAQELDIARQAVEKVLESSPDMPEALCAMARLEIYQGDLPAAKALCEKALASDPEFVSAFGELTAVSEGAFTDEQSSTLEELSKRENLSHDQYAIVEIALGDIARKSGQTDSAFSHYARANESLKKSFALENAAYDHGQELEKFRSLTSTDYSKLASPQSLEPGDAAPIFVVGMPRSGTTLLETIMSAHPKIEGAGELLEMPSIVDEFLYDLKTPAVANAQEYSEKLKTFREKYLASAKRKLADSAAMFVDKQPLNFKAVGLIRTLFPEAPIFLMQRNPLDVCFSIFRRQFSEHWPFANDLEELGRFYGVFAKYAQAWKGKEGLVHTVQYEELTQEFEKNVRSIIEHCGVEWNEACLAPEKVQRKVMTFSSAQVRRTVDTSFSGEGARFARHLEPLAQVLRTEGVDLKTGALEH